MAEASHAVFLSYASEDAPAAQRIAEALRAAGVEVWFDREELRGGDIWDQKIRQQIRDCRLFVPIISAHTEGRLEGYFRREWKLAVDRTDDMASEVAFLVPVVIDDTPNASAHVPERFRHVQWTRLRSGEPTPGFVALINRLLTQSSPMSEPSRGVQASSHGTASASALAVPLNRQWSRRQLAMIISACAVGVVGLAYFAVNHVSHPVSGRATTATQTTLAAPDKSIAVLPFLDLSEKHDQQYFADGIAEETLNQLAKVSGLKVIGRTSSFQFRGKADDLRKIGATLGAAYVLEGSVRRSGDDFRITAELVDTRSGTNRWSDTFQGSMTDVFRVQDEIAARVAHSLSVEMGQLLREKVVASPEAYDLFLRGSHALEEISTEGIAAGRDYFQKALVFDPQFAPAAVGIAMADLIDCTNGNQADVSCPRAHASVEAALKLDPGSADAYAVRAELRTVFDWDWAGAAEDVKQATALGGGLMPKYAAARLAYGLCDMTRARQLLNEIIASNPFEPNASIDMGYQVELRSGNFAEAESWVQRGLQIAPQYISGLYILGVTQVVQGKLDAALTSMKREKINEGQLAGLPLVYSAMGRNADFDRAMVAMEQNGNYFPSDFARAYAFHGDAARALNYLEKAYASHDVYLWYIKGDPLFRKIEGDPRYKAFLRKMRLPE